MFTVTAGRKCIKTSRLSSESQGRWVGCCNAQKMLQNACKLLGRFWSIYPPPSPLSWFCFLWYWRELTVWTLDCLCLNPGTTNCHLANITVLGAEIFLSCKIKTMEILCMSSWVMTATEKDFTNRSCYCWHRKLSFSVLLISLCFNMKVMWRSVCAMAFKFLALETLTSFRLHILI